MGAEIIGDFGEKMGEKHRRQGRQRESKKKIGSGEGGEELKNPAQVRKETKKFLLKAIDEAAAVSLQLLNIYITLILKFRI